MKMSKGYLVNSLVQPSSQGLKYFIFLYFLKMN